MLKLLVVEDDENLGYVIRDGLEYSIGGYEVLLAKNGVEGIELWKEEQPDVILSDIEMPKMSGFDMVEYIRERDTEIPILFISGCKRSVDITTGFSLGANNYIKKPFTPEELHAHIQALLRMKNDLHMRSEKTQQKIGSFTLDSDRGVLKFESVKTISLTGLEAQVLQDLCALKGEVIKREILLEKHWKVDGRDYFASRCLDVMLSKLRKKLSDDPNVKIQVVKGVGVMLVDQPGNIPSRKSK